jgi:hypothetical protein
MYTSTRCWMSGTSRSSNPAFNDNYNYPSMTIRNAH